MAHARPKTRERPRDMAKRDARADPPDTTLSDGTRAGVGIGAVALLLVLIFAVTIPEPSEFQIFVFRVTLALGAAGIGALLPGVLNVRAGGAKTVIRAGGALALFVLVYLLNPPALVERIRTAASVETAPKPMATVTKTDGNGPDATSTKTSYSAQSSVRPLAPITGKTRITPVTYVEIFRAVGLRADSVGDPSNVIQFLANNDVYTKNDLQEVISNKKAVDAARQLLKTQTGCDPMLMKDGGPLAIYAAYLHRESVDAESVRYVRESIATMGADCPEQKLDAR